MQRHAVAPRWTLGTARGGCVLQPLAPVGIRARDQAPARTAAQRRGLSWACRRAVGRRARRRASAAWVRVGLARAVEGHAGVQAADKIAVAERLRECVAAPSPLRGVLAIIDRLLVLHEGLLSGALGIRASSSAWRAWKLSRGHSLADITQSAASSFALRSRELRAPRQGRLHCARR